MGVGGQHHAPAALPPGKTRYPLYRRLGGSQGTYGRVWKISPTTGIRSPDRPARRVSLYRLSYRGPTFYMWHIAIRLWVWLPVVTGCGVLWDRMYRTITVPGNNRNIVAASWPVECRARHQKCCSGMHGKQLEFDGITTKILTALCFRNISRGRSLTNCC